MALETGSICVGPWAANKALGFPSFLSLPLFCIQQVYLVSSEMGRLDSRSGNTYSFPPSVLNFPKGQS